jgi:hypothetical protein
MRMRAALRRADDSLVKQLHCAARTAKACRLPIAFQLKAARRAVANDYSL